MRGQMFIAKRRNITVYNLAVIKLFLRIFGYSIYEISVYLRDILLITMVVRPSGKVFGDYLRSAFIIPNFEPVIIFISAVNIKDKEDSCGIIHISDTTQCSVLRSERMKKLQGIIIRKLYASWFGIPCSSDDLKVLATYGNTGWLTHNLLLASGIKKKNTVALNNENRRRIKTVYRSFVSSLALYLKLEDGLRNGTAELPKLGIVAKIRRLFKVESPDRVITKNMYPRIIEIQSLKIRRENILSYKLEAVRQIKMNSEYMGFNKYLKAQSLIMEGRIRNRDAAEMLMNKLESLH
jgi:hypothetical protein